MDLHLLHGLVHECAQDAHVLLGLIQQDAHFEVERIVDNLRAKLSQANLLIEQERFPQYNKG